MPFLIVSLSFFIGPKFPRHYEASLSQRAQLSELPTVRPVLLHKGKRGNALCAGFRAGSLSQVNNLYTVNLPRTYLTAPISCRPKMLSKQRNVVAEAMQPQNTGLSHVVQDLKFQMRPCRHENSLRAQKLAGGIFYLPGQVHVLNMLNLCSKTLPRKTLTFACDGVTCNSD